MSMASTGEESAEQDGAQEHAVADAVQALIDHGDDALDGVTPGEEEDEEVDEDEGIPFGDPHSVSTTARRRFMWSTRMQRLRNYIAGSRRIFLSLVPLDWRGFLKGLCGRVERKRMPFPRSIPSGTQHLTLQKTRCCKTRC